METFTGQAARWWETHSPRLQTWTTVSTYFVEQLRDKKLYKVADIPTFKIGYDPVEHIQRCEKHSYQLNENCDLKTRTLAQKTHIFS